MFVTTIGTDPSEITVLNNLNKFYIHADQTVNVIGGLIVRAKSIIMRVRWMVRALDMWVVQDRIPIVTSGLRMGSILLVILMKMQFASLEVQSAMSTEMEEEGLWVS